MAQSLGGDLPRGVTNRLLRMWNQLSESSRTAIKVYFASGNFRYDKRKDGWILLENAPRRISGTVTDVSFHKSSEDWVHGKEVFRRARFELHANLGQEDAEWLEENQSKIPSALQDFVLVFTATVWKLTEDNERLVPCMFHNGVRWYLYFRRLDDIFLRNRRLAAPAWDRF